uniref:Uncharacterized protein n=1 Tax=Falco tinnunculus TaxID=100819 RepID=A0A8C4UUU4_FALTI
ACSQSPSGFQLWEWTGAADLLIHNVLLILTVLALWLLWTNHHRNIHTQKKAHVLPCSPVWWQTASF